MQREAQEKPNKYSKIVVLVCNVPDEQLISDWEQKILEGLKVRYKDVSIIFLSPQDMHSLSDKKFDPLQDLDNNSLIYIVGHTKPGSDAITSDPIYFENKKEPENFYFSCADLADILFSKIDHPNILLDRDNPKTKDLMTAPQRKLKIVIAACHAAVDGKSSEKSFAYKFFNYLYNAHPDKILNCDIVASNAYVFPIGTKPDLQNALLFFLRYLNKVDPGFHKRYTPFEFSLNPLKFMTLFKGLEHHPEWDYKLTFVVSDQIEPNQITSGRIAPRILNPPRAKKYFENQSALTEEGQAPQQKKKG